jgi:hypothetical protein
MSAKMLIKEVKQTLQQRKTSLCCSDVKYQLERLGFEVRDGSKGGHKVYTHDGLPSFFSASFNCGHGKNPEIKPAYINKVINVITQYEDELEKFLESKK